MAELTREYIAQRFDQLRKLAKEKREAESQANQTIPLETIAKEVFNPEEKIVNLDGDVLPF